MPSDDEPAGPPARIGRPPAADRSEVAAAALDLFSRHGFAAHHRRRHRRRGRHRPPDASSATSTPRTTWSGATSTRCSRRMEAWLADVGDDVPLLDRRWPTRWSASTPCPRRPRPPTASACRSSSRCPPSRPTAPCATPPGATSSPGSWPAGSAPLPTPSPPARWPRRPRGGRRRLRAVAGRPPCRPGHAPHRGLRRPRPPPPLTRVLASDRRGLRDEITQEPAVAAPTRVPASDRRGLRDEITQEPAVAPLSRGGGRRRRGSGWGR